MMKPVLAGVLCLCATACAPTNQPMAVAEAQCMRHTLSGGGGVTVGMSVGTGIGNNGWGNNGWGNNGWGNNGWGNNGWGNNGVGVGVTAQTRLPPSQGMAGVYRNCVQRSTGQPPVTPFDQRPEMQG